MVTTKAGAVEPSLCRLFQVLAELSTLSSCNLTLSAWLNKPTACEAAFGTVEIIIKRYCTNGNAQEDPNTLLENIIHNRRIMSEAYGRFQKSLINLSGATDHIRKTFEHEMTFSRSERLDHAHSTAWCQSLVVRASPRLVIAVLATEVVSRNFVKNTTVEMLQCGHDDGLRVLFSVMSSLDRELPHLDYEFPHWDDVNRPRTLKEREIINLEASIRQKSNWAAKLQDETIVSRWKVSATFPIENQIFPRISDTVQEEALSQDIGPDVIEHVVGKLHWLAKDFDVSSGLLPAPSPGVFLSDGLISESDAVLLKQGVAALEAATAGQKDWHPGSNEQVLDIVHPSLYVYTLGRTRHLAPPKHECGAFETVGLAAIDAVHRLGNVLGDPKQHLTLSTDLALNLARNIGSGVPSRVLADDRRLVRQTDRPSSEATREQNGYSVVHEKGDSDRHVDIYELTWPSSSDYLWLPADVLVERVEGGDLKAQFTSYINNLHPDPQTPGGALYPTIGNIFARFVPAFEKVLSLDRDKNRLLDRVQWKWNPEFGCDELPGQKFESGYQMYLALFQHYEEQNITYDADELSERTDEQAEEWNGQKQLVLNVPAFNPSEYMNTFREAPVLSNRTLQVIVKIGKIELTPEKPRYEGGSWHVEGTENEDIVATGIYYFDSENITDNLLEFREAFDGDGDELSHEQDTYDHLKILYGFDNGGADEANHTSQRIGYINTPEGRCIVFPNGMQHKLSDFKLQDKTRPGYRKILVFFLVNPSRRFLSSSLVPPQRLDWWFDTVISQPNTRIGQLPGEILDLIWYFCKRKAYHERNDGGWLISRAEAEDHREALMAERAAFSRNNNYQYEETVSLCEH